MTFEQAQAEVAGMIRARVYEEQWGGSIMDYVRYFENDAAVEAFWKETGNRVEIVDDQLERGAII